MHGPPYANNRARLQIACTHTPVYTHDRPVGGLASGASAAAVGGGQHRFSPGGWPLCSQSGFAGLRHLPFPCSTPRRGSARAAPRPWDTIDMRPPPNSAGVYTTVMVGIGVARLPQSECAPEGRKKCAGRARRFQRQTKLKRDHDLDHPSPT